MFYSHQFNLRYFWIHLIDPSISKGFSLMEQWTNDGNYAYCISLSEKLGLSRTTILYYEKQGLLKPSLIAENGYRWYGESERLKSIISYRSYGLSISDIRLLLEPLSISQGQILENHFRALEQEINNLRAHQKAIIELLKKSILLKEKFVNKAKWVEIMTAAGLSKEDMMKWHQKFEEMEPEEHQKFLKSLDMTQDEITAIRSL